SRVFFDSVDSFDARDGRILYANNGKAWIVTLASDDKPEELSTEDAVSDAYWIDAHHILVAATGGWGGGFTEIGVMDIRSHENYEYCGRSGISHAIGCLTPARGVLENLPAGSTASIPGWEWY